VPEIPPLPESTTLLVEAGSTAHGTGLPGGEDHDEMGVVGRRGQPVDPHVPLGAGAALHARGRELRALGPAFVGRHVIPRYRGYMQAQALRLLGLRGGAHGRRGEGRRQELIAAHGYDTKWARCLVLDARLAAALDDDRAPARPQQARIEAWLVQTHLDRWAVAR
jgi:hypothetical protein